MEYYKLLQLEREPFSNSPDPEYFFNSRQHMECLQKLELALRLKRGLNVIIGDVGTGKTTLCRQLLRRFTTEPGFEIHLILDPTFDTSTEFLKAIIEMICSSESRNVQSQTEMKEQIKRSLFQSGVDENKTIVLIIDEGQKISEPCLEILRELLNFETNTHKLLQIVIFAQTEFNTILQTHANFADRINLLHHLKPLRFTDTKQLIQHRLKLSSTRSRSISLFTLPALWAIYRASRGYPRKIIHICHQSILALIIQNQTKAGWMLIQSCKKRLSISEPQRRNRLLITLSACLAALAIIALLPALKAPDTPSILPNSSKTVKIKSAAPHAAAKENSAEPQSATNINTHKNPLQPIGLSSEDNEESPEAFPNPKTEITDADKPETASDAAPLSSQSDVYPPEVLGQLMVKPGDTLSIMALDVYGTTHNRFLRSVITSNSHIQDPNNIDIGNLVYFPSIVQSLNFPETPFYLVVLGEYNTLPAAMQTFQKIAEALGSKPNLVASWSPDRGLRFQIIRNKFFTSRQAGSDFIDMLPHDMAARSHILSGWPDNTVFYSNPFKDMVPFSFKGEG